jgi:hypothetical protein
MVMQKTASGTTRMRMSWQGVLLSALLALAGGPAIAKPSIPPAEPSASCPPGVREFLEAVGLSPELPDHARPIVLIDVHGHPLDCLPRTLPAREQAQAAAFLHQSGIIMAQDQEAGPVCRIGEARLEDTSFIGLIVSYDLAWMKSPTCLQRARQDLNVLQDRSLGKAAPTQP